MKQVSQKEWLQCKLGEYGARYLVTVYEYLDHMAIHDEQWERLAYELKSLILWQDELLREEDKVYVEHSNTSE